MKRGAQMKVFLLLMLLLCGVCLSCNKHQEVKQEVDSTKVNKNMTNEQLREKLVLVLDDMKAKAVEMGIEGVATASVLNKGETDDWIGEMKVVGSPCNEKEGWNLVAIAWSKCGEVIATHADSGNPNHQKMMGELGFVGGAYDNTKAARWPLPSAGLIRKRIWSWRSTALSE